MGRYPIFVFAVLLYHFINYGLMDSKIKQGQFYGNVFNNAVNEVIAFDKWTLNEDDVARAWELYSNSQKAIDLAISTLQQLKTDVRFQMGLYVIEHDY